MATKKEATTPKFKKGDLIEYNNQWGETQVGTFLEYRQSVVVTDEYGGEKVMDADEASLFANATDAKAKVLSILQEDGVLATAELIDLTDRIVRVFA